MRHYYVVCYNDTTGDFSVDPGMLSSDQLVWMYDGGNGKWLNPYDAGTDIAITEEYDFGCQAVTHGLRYVGDVIAIDRSAVYGGED